VTERDPDVSELYDRWSATYDSDLNATRDLDAIVLREAGLPVTDRDVCELGCGTGKNTEWLAERASLVLALDRRDCHRLLRADRRAARALRPVVGPADVTRYSTARAASLFALAGPLPPRARRVARELGLEPPGADPFPPPSGPRLLFAEGATTPAFLFDARGTAVALPGTGSIAPADPFLVGLLHTAPVAVLIGARCPDGISAHCLARVPVRLPDPYDERERRLGDDVAALVRERLAVTGWTREADCDRERLEAAIDRAIEQLYTTPSP
jgi:hypothetical protein